MGSLGLGLGLRLRAETGWTGELGSNCVLLILENKRIAFYCWHFFLNFLKRSDFQRFFKIFFRFLDF